MIILNCGFFILFLFNYPQFDNVVDEDQSGRAIANLFIQAFLITYWALAYYISS